MKCSLLPILSIAIHLWKSKSHWKCWRKKKMFKIYLWIKFWSQIYGYKCSCIVTKIIILPCYSYKSPLPSVKNPFKEMLEMYCSQQYALNALSLGCAREAEEGEYLAEKQDENNLYPFFFSKSSCEANCLNGSSASLPQETWFWYATPTLMSCSFCI